MPTPQREAALFEYFEIKHSLSRTVLAAPELLLKEPVFRCK
jgi:hypothetical protein